MKPIYFPGHNMVIAKDQSEYLPLPAYKKPGKEGDITSCWKLSFKERLRMLFTGKIYWSQWTFGDSLQPQRPSLYHPFTNK